MASKTFVLGAGFSALGGMPLVRELRNEVLSRVEKENQPSSGPNFSPSLHGYRTDEFYRGRSEVDPDSSLGFEELLLALHRRLSNAHNSDPCHVTLPVLRYTCAKLLWEKQRALSGLPIEYQNFATWMREHDRGRRNAIVSLNWDLVVEHALWKKAICWAYTGQTASHIAILKPHGSINWSRHLEEGLVPDARHLQPIAHGSPYSFNSRDPFSDPFPQGINQDLRYMILPGDPEEVAGVQLLWDEAERAICQRDIVVFIGYSLPSYDSDATNFFKRVTAGKRIEVYVRSSATLLQYRNKLGDISMKEPIRFEECPYTKAY